MCNMLSIQELNEFERDTLKEISNICIQNSNKSLSKLIKHPIKLKSARIYEIKYRDFLHKAKKDEKIILVYTKASKDLPFQSIFYLTPHNTKNLIGTIFNKYDIINEESMTNFAKSAMLELANIYNNSLFKTLEKLIQINLIGERAIIVKEKQDVVFDYIFRNTHRKCNYLEDKKIICLEGIVDIADSDIHANYLLIPELPTCERMFRCLKDAIKQYD